MFGDVGKGKATIGIRPEYIALGEEGVPAKVLSSLPSGMETIVHLALKTGLSLTCVVFGQKDYAVGKELGISFPSSHCMLFGADGSLRGLGKLDCC